MQNGLLQQLYGVKPQLTDPQNTKVNRKLDSSHLTQPRQKKITGVGDFQLKLLSQDEFPKLLRQHHTLQAVIELA